MIGARAMRTALMCGAALAAFALHDAACAAANVRNIRFNEESDRLRVVFDLERAPDTGDIAVAGRSIIVRTSAVTQAAESSAQRLPPRFLVFNGASGDGALGFELSENATIKRTFELPRDPSTAKHRVVFDLAYNQAPPGPPALRDGPALPHAAAALVAAQVGGVRDRTEEAEGEAPAAEVDSRDLARVLGVSNDDVRPDDQLEISVFGAPMTIGGELEAAGRSQSNYDLDGDAADYRLQALPEVKLEALYLPSDNVAAFVQAKAFVESELADADGSTTTEAGVSLDQAWVFFSNIFGLDASLQLGRQKFQDRREWWWDDDLEAARLHFGFGDIFGFFAVAEKLWNATTNDPLKPEDRDLFRVMGNVAYTIDPKKQVDFYFLRQNDHSGVDAPGVVIAEDLEDAADADLTWIGLRYRGRHKIKPIGKVYFNVDAARVAGDEAATDYADIGGDLLIAGASSFRNVRGWAVDASVNWEMPFAFEPYLTLGYARGSGDDDPDDAVDRNFRQTGLHGDNGKFRGISRFRYYGEVLRPDLSNLQILTASFGAPLSENLWVETVYHNYRQLAPQDEIVASRLDMEPLGLDPDIGDEIDVIFSYEYLRRWEAELTLGAFRAGEAFGPAEGSWAHSAAFKVNYNF